MVLPMPAPREEGSKPQSLCSLLDDPSVIDLTDRKGQFTFSQKNYQVTGYAEQGKYERGVLIYGKIYTVGDLLDGMRIIGMYERTVFLERNGLKYKIEFIK